jgi:ATP-dependent helicase HrpA
MALLRRRRGVKEQIQRFGELAKKSRSFSDERNTEYLQLLDEILPPDFLERLSLESLLDCDRYLQSLSIRIERAHADYAKEQGKREKLAPHLQNYNLLKNREAGLTDECVMLVKEYGMMINEFRISLFSPEIRTKIPVSEKKLSLHWQTIRNLC